MNTPFNSTNSGFTLDLPDWAVEELNKLPTHFSSNEERMTAVIEFSRLNFQRGTGAAPSPPAFSNTILAVWSQLGSIE